ncbi:hypothetical protein SY88_04660 [Clostridiales bacterium PH28_bin88]|nr:hypothetical protein SY88_04660 [Clostridiales bacterium PH28_bin88]
MLAKIRHFRRYVEILLILGRHALGYLWGRAVSQPGRGTVPQAKPLPGWEGRGYEETPSGREVPRLRRLFEDLGPTFIKLGQVLSSRPDLVPRELAEDLRGLQDAVRGFGPEEVRTQICQELGSPPESLFVFFDYCPVAAASVAQVHRAVLGTGEQVAVKVQRPGLRVVVERDLSLLPGIAGLLNRTVIGRTCSLEEIVEVFSRQIRREMDFTVEGLCMEAFREIYALCPGIVIPRVYWDYTTSQVLTMDYVAGQRIEQWERGGGDGGPLLARTLLHALLLPFFKAGMIYADPHPGNVLFLPQGQVALVDFGMVGRMDDTFRFQVARLLLALEARDVEAVMDFTTKVGEVTREINRQELYEDLAELMDKTCRLDRGSINLGHLVTGMVQVSLRHGVKVPGSFLAIGKAVLAGEGLARRLDPHVDVLAVARPLAAEYMRSRLRPDMNAERLYQRVAGMVQTLSTVPGDIARLIGHLAEGKFTTIFVHRGLDTLYDSLDVVSMRISLSVLAGALMGGSALVLHAGAGPRVGGLSVLGLAGFLVAVVMAVWMALGMLRHGKLK